MGSPKDAGQGGRCLTQSLLCAHSCARFGCSGSAGAAAGSGLCAGSERPSSRSSLPALTRCVYFPTDAFVPGVFSSAVQSQT